MFLYWETESSFSFVFLDIFFLIFFALYAYLRVLFVSSSLKYDGVIQAIMIVIVFPPNECFNNLVSFESR